MPTPGNNARNVDKTGSKENNGGFTVGGLSGRITPSSSSQPSMSGRPVRISRPPTERCRSKPSRTATSPVAGSGVHPGREFRFCGRTDAAGPLHHLRQIYDPATSRQLGRRHLDPGSLRGQYHTYLAVQQGHPDDPPELRLSGSAGNTFRRNQPWISGCCPNLNIDNYSIKVDQVLTNKHKLSGLT